MSNNTKPKRENSYPDEDKRVIKRRAPTIKAYINTKKIPLGFRYYYILRFIFQYHFILFRIPKLGKLRNIRHHSAIAHTIPILDRFPEVGNKF